MSNATNTISGIQKTVAPFRMLSCQMTEKEAAEVLRHLNSTFFAARLVDAGENIQIRADENGNLYEDEYHCYCLMNREERCVNCVSAKCICSRERVDKFEFQDNDLYYVNAFYVEVDGNPFALEIVTKVSDKTLISGYGKEKIVNIVTAHNKRLFMDALSGVYNRTYYEEQVSGLPKIAALAMVDVNNFKIINDSYGHQTGDLAIRQIAAVIQQCIRKSDVVIRYGGDEFVIVFHEIEEFAFHQRLQEIQQKVSESSLENNTEVQLSISIGGSYGPECAEKLLAEADKRMYQNKRKS